MELYEQFRYIAPYDWLINKNIQEWDLKQANISILRTLDVITEEQYLHYRDLPKEQREIAIGKLRKDPNIEASYKKGLALAKHLFFEKNNLTEENILYIDHDSITTVHDWSDSRAIKIDGNITPLLQFRTKNKYTSFYRLFTIDFLYFNIGYQEHFRFKNINEVKLRSKHKDYFIDLLLSIAYSAQTESLLETLNMIKNIYQSYCNKEMELEYYREFTTDSKFRLVSTNFYTYYAENVEESNREFIDINYNADIIRQFYKIFMTEYFRQNQHPRQ